MIHWTNGYETFEDQDEAYERACEDITWDDIESYFLNNISFHDFFNRVRQNMRDTFFETFENELCDAENDYFNQNYWIVEEEEEE